MRIGGGGSQDVNLLQSDAAQYRNQDFASSQGLAFMGDTTQAAVAGEISMVQLFNPAGSGKIVIVDSILASSDTAGRIAVFEYDTAFTTVTGVWRNLLRAGAAGTAVRRKQTNATALGTNFGAVELPANGAFLVPFVFPAILLEGEGLHISQGIVNTTLTATFIGREL